MTSDAQARTSSCTFPVVVLPPPQLTVTSFLAYGDSVTYGEDGTASAAALARQHIFVQLPPGERYPDVLQAELIARYRLQSPTVFGDGHSGESLSDGLSSDCQGGNPNQSVAFQHYTSAMSTGHYDALLLMEGSNDVDGAVGDSCLLSKAISVLRAMIDDGKARGARVILGTIPPMVPPGANSRAKGYLIVPNYNDMVRALAGSEGVPIADVYTAFGSDAPTLIGFDGLHPNAAGYQRIADTFFSTIKGSFETQATPSKTGLRRARLP
jgi:lysophospholipase L1-like esterase